MNVDPGDSPAIDWINKPSRDSLPIATLELWCRGNANCRTICSSASPSIAARQWSITTTSKPPNDSGRCLRLRSPPLEGIDLNLVGFTESTLFDAGSARLPAIHALEAGGGNNDAAALWHVAQQALRSKRTSKILVMISDGLPTECSVAALRALVAKLTNQFQICCAQIAVEQLSEICFPHYVLVKESDEFAAITKFGKTIANLVRQNIST